ncbi:MAG TPA: DUF4124 domain-containing protein [Pseudoxanthomonas sp.]|nr:DUF4124 domain-containing protein [Pseudoxanthomonas sp.]
MRATFRSLSAAVVLGSLLAAASLSAQAAPVYQWKDANGVTHYSDKPPAGEQYKDRRIDPRGEPLAQSEPAGKSVASPQCLQARKNLEVLSSSTRVLQAGEDGKPGGQPLDEQQRANQRALAEAAQKAYCTP